MKVIIYGDSLAGNYGIAPEKAWPELIREATTKGSDEYQVIFKNGFTCSDLLTELNRDVLSKQPDRVIFICGSNDALRLKNKEAIFKCIKLMAEESAKSNAEPIWIIPPRIDTLKVSDTYGDPLSMIQAADQILKELRAMVMGDPPKFKVIDLESIRIEYLTDHSESYWDGLHFNAMFQRYLAERLKPMI